MLLGRTQRLSCRSAIVAALRSKQVQIAGTNRIQARKQGNLETYHQQITFCCFVAPAAALPWQLHLLFLCKVERGPIPAGGTSAGRSCGVCFITRYKLYMSLFQMTTLDEEDVILHPICVARLWNLMRVIPRLLLARQSTFVLDTPASGNLQYA